MVKYTLKSLRCEEHCKIFKVYLTIFHYYTWKCGFSSLQIWTAVVLESQHFISWFLLRNTLRLNVQWLSLSVARLVFSPFSIFYIYNKDSQLRTYWITDIFASTGLASYIKMGLHRGYFPVNLAKCFTKAIL